MKGRVLVTGCAGFIGSHLAERLVNEGYSVVCVDCFTPYYSPMLKKLNIKNLMKHPGFKLVELDLSEVSVNELASLLRGVDHVVHEAAQPGVRGSWGSDFQTYVKHNIIATQKLLEAATRVDNVKRFIFASSSSVYGNVREELLREDLILSPFSPYGVTKLAGEALCRAYHDNFNVPIVVLRYFTVYGPRQRPDMAFHRFIKAMLKGEPIEVYGDGGQLRDFTYVDDVVDATIRALRVDEAVGEVINVGSGRPVRLIDAIKLIAEILGVEPRVIFKGEQKGDVRHTYADISRATRLLGWKPTMPLKEGLENQVLWMKQIMESGLI